MQNQWKDEKFSNEKVEEIYQKVLKSDFDINLIQEIESCYFLENFLIPNVNSNKSMVMSIVLMVNEKFRTKRYLWDSFSSIFSALFTNFKKIFKEIKNPKEKIEYIQFLINCFQSFEYDFIRKECLSIINLGILEFLSNERRVVEEENYPKLKTLKSNENNFMITLLQEFALEKDENYKEKFTEFLIDLLSQLSTRKYIHILLDDYLIYLYTRGNKFHSLFKYFFKFENEDVYQSKLVHLQRISFKKGIKDIYLNNISFLEKNFSKIISRLKDDEIIFLFNKLNYSTRDYQIQDIKDYLIFLFERYTPETRDILPTEKNITMESFIPFKLNLQFLSMKDYLYRNLNLFHYSVIYDIKMDLIDIINRMSPKVNPLGKIEFQGWHKMAMPLSQYEISGEKGILYYNTKNKEWGEMKTHDIIFLIHINQKGEIEMIRGCQVVYQQDQDGQTYTGLGDNVVLKGEFRKLSVQFDSKQMSSQTDYKFNLMIKKKKKENNFKPILENIESIKPIMPEWLSDLYLGYGLETNNVSVPFKKRTRIQYTEKQNQAIEKGMNHGLSIILGPPGTGKTFMTSELVSTIYENFPNEKTLIITKTNYCLNEIFNQLKDIDPKYLLRLGYDNTELNRYGRVNHILQNRIDLLKKLNLDTCEQGIIHLSDTEHIKELREYFPFEIIRTYQERCKHLINQISKVIGMTSTFYAMKHKEFNEMGLKFDNLIVEEASQLLDIETFILMNNNFKRIILIGDPNQLPPIIKNQHLKTFSNFNQSLFTRFIRLGLPTITLDHQGRSIPEIANLYRWRYSDLKDMKISTQAMKGFKYSYQFINVEDYYNQGETCPNSYFYQNLGEAEYVVAVYMYMRLSGYSRDQITILTTYNGQKELIKDILDRRCSNFEIFGNCKVSTVDKYQGQQNDVILLSLVRTKSVGHLRDLNRFIVAFSRARFGFYIFGRLDLFKKVEETKKTFEILLERPTNLMIKIGDEEKEIKDVIEMGKYVYDEGIKRINKN